MHAPTLSICSTTRAELLLPSWLSCWYCPTGHRERACAAPDMYNHAVRLCAAVIPLRASLFSFALPLRGGGAEPAALAPEPLGKESHSSSAPSTDFSMEKQGCDRFKPRFQSAAGWSFVHPRQRHRRPRDGSCALDLRTEICALEGGGLRLLDLPRRASCFHLMPLPRICMPAPLHSWCRLCRCNCTPRPHSTESCNKCFGSEGLPSPCFPAGRTWPPSPFSQTNMLQCLGRPLQVTAKARVLQGRDRVSG